MLFKGAIAAVTTMTTTATAAAMGSSIKDVGTEGGGRVKPNADKSGQKGREGFSESGCPHFHMLL